MCCNFYKIVTFSSWPSIMPFIIGVSELFEIHALLSCILVISPHISYICNVLDPIIKMHKDC